MDVRFVDTKPSLFKVCLHTVWRVVLVVPGQIISASSRRLPILVGQSASAINTQSDSSQWSAL